MSQWTHFLGTIQCSRSREAVEAALGKPVLWGDDDHLEYGTPEYEEWYENTWTAAFRNFGRGGIPMGSEGSVNWHFTKTGNGEYTAIGEGSLVAIEGDLRDFGEEESDITNSINWFLKACETLHARTAVLRIEVECGKTVLVEYDWGKAYTTVLRDRRPTGDAHE